MPDTLLIWNNGDITRKWFDDKELEQLRAGGAHKIKLPHWRDMKDQTIDPFKTQPTDDELAYTIEHIFKLVPSDRTETVLAEWGLAASDALEAAEAFREGCFVRSFTWKDGTVTRERIKCDIERRLKDRSGIYEHTTADDRTAQFFLSTVTPPNQPPAYREL